tara:strand:- start:355 stop:852 length:498 start_codon:yes stop_codon:yes gene_type:complete
VDPKIVEDLVDHLSPFISTVGLFVNPCVDEVDSVLHQVVLGLLQFHGDETDDFCKRFNRPFIKAIRVKPEMDVEAEIAKYPSASGILLDTYDASAEGGTGKTFDWSQANVKTNKPIILAGGLTADNVKDAIEMVHPFAVDVSSGIEESPGVKSDEKMLRFVEACG